MRRRSSIESRLREARAPGESQSEQRGWSIVRDAYADAPTASGPRVRRRMAAGLAPALAILAGVLTLTPAGATVHHWIEQTLGVQHARATLAPLPSPGRILVSGPGGTSTISANGQVRRIGPWTQATFSPRGLYIAAVAGRRLIAVDPRGVEHWAVMRPGVSRPRWFSPSGYRMAYLSAGSLRVIAGDGSGDRLLAPVVAPVAPAWRPGNPYELAYATPHGAVVARDADSGQVIFTRRVPAPRALAWSDDAQRLLVLARLQAVVLDPSGHTIARISGRARDGALSPDGSRLALIGDAGVTLTQLRPHPGPPHLLFAGAGLRQLSFSPDGRWLLVSWPAADQWVFIRTVGTPRIVAVSHIDRQLDLGRGFPTLEGWCCTTRGASG